MRIIRDNDITFLTSIPSVKAKVFVNEKCVYSSLVTNDNTDFLAMSSELGDVVIDFLYNPLYEQVVGFLEVSKELVVKIKSGDTANWTRFEVFANVLFDEGRMHPFYYPLFVQVSNAFRFGMRNAQGESLPDDFFVKQAESLKALKQQVLTMLDAQDAVEDIGKVIHCYHKTVLQSPVQISNVQAEFIKGDDESPKLVITLMPKTPIEIWNYLLPAYISAGMRFKRCDNCKRFFATTGRGNPKFCERIIEGKGKSCRQLMPKLNFNSKADKDPAVYLYNRAYKTMYSRVTTGTMEKTMFKEWAERARAMRDACSAGTMTAEEYSTWLCDNGLFIDYLKK